MMTYCILPRICWPKCWESKGRQSRMPFVCLNVLIQSSAVGDKSRSLIARASCKRPANATGLFASASRSVFPRHIQKSEIPHRLRLVIYITDTGRPNRYALVTGVVVTQPPPPGVGALARQELG